MRDDMMKITFAILVVGLAGSSHAQDASAFGACVPDDGCFIGYVSDGPSFLTVNVDVDELSNAAPLNLYKSSAAEKEGSAEPLDLSQHVGSAIMVQGTFVPKQGVYDAKIVDAAGPLLTDMIIRMDLTFGQAEIEEID